MPADLTPGAMTADGVAAVDRALLVAAALAQAGSALGLADLARVTGLYKSTLLRLLVSLQRSGLVSQRSDKRYALGPLAYLFGRSFEQAQGLREVVLPLLARLSAQGTESPSFHVLHGRDTRLCLFRIDSPHATIDRVREGDLLPLDRGAGGHALRAFAQGATNAAARPLVFTSHGERDPQCAAVACPVFGPGGLLMGALSVSGPLERFTPPAVDTMSRLLLAAAETATRTLGGTWPKRR